MVTPGRRATSGPSQVGFGGWQGFAHVFAGRDAAGQDRIYAGGLQWRAVVVWPRRDAGQRSSLGHGWLRWVEMFAELFVAVRGGAGPYLCR